MTTSDTLGDDLSLSEAHLAALHAQLALAADHNDLLDVAYRVIDSPIGQLFLAATRRGVVRIAFEHEDFDAVLDTLAARLSPRILAAPQRLDVAARELDEYFAGSRHRFDVPLDRALSAAGFRRTVQEYLTSIGYGRTATYRQIAEEVGRPRAVRAVGSACATNPLPIVVPCHRVVRSDGRPGGYLGGPEAKSALLALERGA